MTFRLFKYSCTLSKMKTQEQTLVKTLLPHVVRPTISLMNTNLVDIHNFIFFYKISCPVCGGGRRDSSTPHAPPSIFIIALSSRR